MRDQATDDRIRALGALLRRASDTPEGYSALCTQPSSSALDRPHLPQMDLFSTALSSHLVEYIPPISLTLSFVLLLSILISRYLYEPGVSPGASYAFSASTIVRQRPPTVLQFSARVPLGSGATPMLLRTIDNTGEERHTR